MATITQRDKFDPGRDFMVVRQFRCDGVDLAPGQDFTKHTVNLRKLRQLFDQKFISMQPEEFEYDDPIDELIRRPHGGPDFGSMSMDQLRDYLKGKGIVARLGWDRGKLLERIAATP